VSDESADPIDSAWSALLERWDEPARHKAFVALAASLDRLPDAAARYRAVEADPARAEGAAQGKERVLAAALAHIDALPRTTREEARRHGRWLVPVAALGLLYAVSLMGAELLQRPALRSPLTLALETAAVALLPWRRMLR